MKKTKNTIVTAAIPVRKKGDAVTVCIIIVKWDNFPHVSSQMILNKHMIEVSKDSSKYIKNKAASEKREKLSLVSSVFNSQ